MTSGELFTAALSHKLNIGGGDALVPAKRGRAAFHGNALAQKGWGAYPWSFKVGSGTVVLTAGSGSMPADYAGLGRRTRVFISGQTQGLRFKQPDELMEMRRLNPSTSDRTLYYTLRGQTAAGRKKVEVWPANSGAVTLQVENYVVKTPRLVDYPDKPTLVQGIAGALTGVYRYRLTSIHPEGETEGGEVSAAITVAAKHITVTFPSRVPDSVLTAWGLYRTAAGGSAYLKVGDVAIGTPTYDDNLADGGLGAACPTPVAAVSGLERIPSDWHESLMFDGLCGRLERDQGNVRSVEKDSDFLKGLRTAWTNERLGLNTTRRMPRYRASAFRI